MPTDMTFGPGGDLYVSCFKSHEIRRFSKDGVYRGVFASNIDSPLGLVWGECGSQKMELFVVSTAYNAVYRVTPQGKSTAVDSTRVGKDILVVRFSPHTGDMFVSGSDGLHMYACNDDNVAYKGKFRQSTVKEPSFFGWASMDDVVVTNPVRSVSQNRGRQNIAVCYIFQYITLYWNRVPH
eukprot:TRINITY_DN817_c0_g1_i2.p1 TRINITY_DN817_c0_g1~~TRINITY_DN817_c0_g1_i2.p1  ORF type:complete len:181 (+),score=13.21 TRINITY_DN817_c0_g1_i2:556-1098(+)